MIILVSKLNTFLLCVHWSVNIFKFFIIPNRLIKILFAMFY